MKKIIVVGCGGIGSYFCRELHTLLINGQVDATVTLSDSDLVAEKNLRYQNFEAKDIFLEKSLVLGQRYGFHFFTENITKPEQLDPYDIVVSCVDANDFRKLLYEWGEQNPDKYWLDLRSEGRSVAFFTKHKKNTKDFMESTLSEGVTKGSCQLPQDLAEDRIQQGNKIIATIGSQLLLNYMRGENNVPFYTHTF